MRDKKNIPYFPISFILCVVLSGLEMTTSLKSSVYVHNRFVCSLFFVEYFVCCFLKPLVPSWSTCLQVNNISLLFQASDSVLHVIK